MHYKEGLLIPEQVMDTNPLFNLAIIPHDSTQQFSGQRNAHTHHRVSPDSLYISDPYPAFHYIVDAPINSSFLLQSRICRQTPTMHITSTFDPLYSAPSKVKHNPFQEAVRLSVCSTFELKWHEPHDAVQCHAHGSTFEFLFEFQTKFFSNFLFKLLENQTI
jgi:hypothetical protein